MGRFNRRSLVCLGSVVLVVVSAYVLFDLLDIDGSNFHNRPDVLLLDAKAAGGDGDPHGLMPGILRGGFFSLLPAARLSVTFSAQAPPPRSSSRLLVRSRRTILRELAPAEDGSDPASRIA